MARLPLCSMAPAAQTSPLEQDDRHGARDPHLTDAGHQQGWPRGTLLNLLHAGRAGEHQEPCRAAHGREKGEGTLKLYDLLGAVPVIHFLIV